MDDTPKYLTIKSASEVYKHIYSRSAFINLFRYRHTNGLDKCVRKVGNRKLIIVTKEFENWIESHKNERC